MAAVRTNYGQVPSSVHAFVGSVAVAGAEGGLWSIEGGNHMLPKKLLLLSEAVQIQSKVGKLRKNSTGTFEIFAKDGKQLGQYDVTILATPMTQDTQSMEMEGIEFEHVFPGTYHRTVATMVEGDINNKDILTKTNFIIDPDNNVNSIAVQNSVDSRDSTKK